MTPTAEKSAEPNIGLITWYREHQRRLPWRETRDPYAIWVSETMLQQTRVDTVIPYYHRFLSQFPDVQALADATEAQLLKCWQGLGYYSRVLNLQKAAQRVVSQYGGVIPNTPDEFQSLPGVGPYTCGAVLSIAFHQPVPAVDGNALRVMARYLGIHEAVDKPAVRRRISDEIRAWMKDVNPAELTQAVMELGATICTPRSPKCAECPLRAGCSAYQNGETESLPVRTKKQPRKQTDVLALWVEEGDRVLVEQRPETGLLAGLWQLPALEVPRSPEALSEASQIAHLRAHFPMIWQTDYALGEQADEACEPAVSYTGRHADAERAFAPVATAREIFTHLEWYVTVFRPVSWARRLTEQEWQLFNPRYKLVRLSDLAGLAWPKVYAQLVSAFLDAKQ